MKIISERNEVPNRVLVLISLLGFLVGLVAGYVVWGLPSDVEAGRTYWICHREPQKNPQSLELDWNGAYYGHINQHKDDSWGECPEPTPTPTPEPTETPEPTPTPTETPEPTLEPTTRMCHWLGEGYEAIAVTEGARERHFNAHKEDKDWSEGMDEWCEVEEEPTPTPTPIPTHTPEPQPEEHHSDPSAPQCTATAPVLLPGNPLVWRLGGTAIVQWQPTDGNKAHIYYYQNEDPGNQHAVRDIDNSGYVEIHELSGLNWTFGIQQANDCAGGEIVWIVDGLTDTWVLFR